MSDAARPGEIRGGQWGDHNTQINYFRDRKPVSWPHLVGSVPREADCYQQRESTEELDKALSAEGTVVLTQVLAGLGGVGKTQLAARHANQAWHTREVDLLVWTSASGRQAVVAAYAEAAADIDLAAADLTDAEQRASRFLAWLHRTDKRWLVVLDDLSEPAVLNGLWPPDNPAGRTIVTTKRRDAALAAQRRRLVEVGLFTPDEARRYMAQRLAERPDALDEATEMADDLGHLPLALAQATAYILDQGLSCAEYRHRFADRQRRLADVLPNEAALPDEHQATVAATWSLSIDLADRLPPTRLARPVLQLASLLDPNGIPAEVFTTPAALAYLSDVRGDTAPVTAEDAADALWCLHRLSLLNRDPTNTKRTAHVHSLVQRATREQVTPEQLTAAARAAASALTKVWPKVERDQELCQALRDNATALDVRAGAELWQHDDYRVLFHTAESFGNSGQVDAAVEHSKRLHAAATHHLGPNHPDTLATRGLVAHMRGQAGDPAGAAAAYTELLADMTRVLGRDHPHTLTTRASLAHWEGKAGNPGAAAAVHLSVVADMIRVLGPDHPHTLATRASLAHWRGQAGDPRGAAAAYTELLKDQLRVLGPDHPDTLATPKVIAYWQRRAGGNAGT